MLEILVRHIMDLVGETPQMNDKGKKGDNP